MYLSSLHLQNFRKFGSKDDKKDLTLSFRPGLNLLVGENDSGKSCVIDAIHYVLYDESHGWLRVSEEDFYPGADSLAIECEFAGITDEEATGLLEWLSFDDAKNYRLKIMLRAEKRGVGIYSETKAGGDSEGAPLSKEARQFLCATYLKPLRDAEKELSPGKRSRLAQILGSHPEVVSFAGTEHPIVEAIDAANATIKGYFRDAGGSGHGVYQALSENMESLRREGSELKPQIDLDTPSLQRILEKLALRFGEDTVRPGLGSQNLLFIAAELLMLKQEREWLKLALVEELEAHLDPQAQLRVMQFLEQESANDLQIIVSTHSPVLASTADLEGLTLFRYARAFPMDCAHTGLDASDYAFLRRFLDATKSNLFFAAGVIIVEGPSENILFPVLAKIVTGHSLAKYGVSIVNVGSTALLRYARIFHRKDGTSMGIPVSCVTDCDVPPAEAKPHKIIKEERKTKADFDDGELVAKFQSKDALLESGDVRVFRSPVWTLEFDLALSTLAPMVHQAISLAKVTEDASEPLDDVRYKSILTAARAEYDAWVAVHTSLDVACLIYSPLATRKASKAVAAGHLAEILEGAYELDQAAFQAEIMGDSHLEYLIQAVLHATGAA